MGTEGVVSHQLGSHLCSKFRFKSALNIYGGHLGMFAHGIVNQLLSLPIQVGVLGIRLGTHRNILARSHRGCSGDKTGNPCNQDIFWTRTCRSYAKDKAGRGNNAVICPKNSRAQPSNALCPVSFSVSHG